MEAISRWNEVGGDRSAIEVHLVATQPIVLDQREVHAGYVDRRAAVPKPEGCGPKRRSTVCVPKRVHPVYLSMHLPEREHPQKVAPERLCTLDLALLRP